MKSIYKLQSSSRHNSAFVHNVDENSPYLDRSKPDSEMSIAYHVIRQCWKPYTENYVVPKLTLRSSDDGKKIINLI
ncbi:hypothetical protein [Shewanella woodyi]|uniref:hypothetical protein n=1 Tax=Shewanella woodyi TaxID=60961 RepID=UPI00374930DA